MDISKITDPEAKRFIKQFVLDRTINREFYQRVPEDQMDFQMTPKSDSPRKSFAHQIDTTRDYISGVKTGILNFGIKYDDLENLAKDELFKKLDTAESELTEILADPDIKNKTVKVPWSKDPISAVASLWGLDSHEILHTGWNLALMDHLNIERFPALKEMWG